MRRLLTFALALLVLAATGPVSAQNLRADDAASDGADSLGPGLDRSTDAAMDGVGATARRGDGAENDEGFSQDEAAAARTFNGGADAEGLGSAEGTLQESGEVIGGILR